MSQKVNDAIQKVIDEKETLKAIKLCEIDLFEMLEVEELDDTYITLDLDIQYGKFKAFRRNNKIVFVKALNEENGFGKLVLIPEEVTEEEYSILNEGYKKKSNALYKFLQTISFVTYALVVLYVILEIANNGFSLYTFLQTFFWLGLPSTLLASICLGIAKILKNK